MARGLKRQVSINSRTLDQMARMFPFSAVGMIVEFACQKFIHEYADSASRIKLMDELAKSSVQWETEPDDEAA